MAEVVVQAQSTEFSRQGVTTQVKGYKIDQIPALVNLMQTVYLNSAVGSTIENAEKNALLAYIVQNPAAASATFRSILDGIAALDPTSFNGNAGLTTIAGQSALSTTDVANVDGQNPANFVGTDTLAAIYGLDPMLFVDLTNVADVDPEAFHGAATLDSVSGQSLTTNAAISDLLALSGTDFDSKTKLDDLLTADPTKITALAGVDDIVTTNFPGRVSLEALQVALTDLTALGLDALASLYNLDPFGSDYETGTQALYARSFAIARSAAQSGPANVRGGTAQMAFELAELDTQQSLHRFEEIWKNQLAVASLITGAAQAANSVQAGIRSAAIAERQRAQAAIVEESRIINEQRRLVLESHQVNLQTIHNQVTRFANVVQLINTTLASNRSTRMQAQGIVQAQVGQVLQSVSTSNTISSDRRKLLLGHRELKEQTIDRQVQRTEQAVVQANSVASSIKSELLQARRLKLETVQSQVQQVVEAVRTSNAVIAQTREQQLKVQQQQASTEQGKVMQTLAATEQLNRDMETHLRSLSAGAEFLGLPMMTTTEDLTGVGFQGGQNTSFGMSYWR